ncbi:DNA/RNA non-specific endonuclease [Pseudoduganella sp. S-14]|uniref:DNA/RNA non-specific endonuclease n=1 Tax=Pseudoduganella sp. S-14 TaxID=3404065 RepID=UPI003CF258DD
MPAEFPNTPNLNGGAYKRLENQLRNMDKAGDKVHANFEAVYNEGNLTHRPEGFRVTYQVNGGIPIERNFINQPGG